MAKKQTAKKAAKKSTKKEKVTEIVVPEIKMERIVVPVQNWGGPLVCHAWSEKAVTEMLNKHMHEDFEVRQAKDPEALYQSSMYRLGKEGYGFPATAFKSAIVTAATDIEGLAKALLRRSLFVVADGEEDRVFEMVLKEKTDAKGKVIRKEQKYIHHIVTPLVKIDGTPNMRMDMVRLSGASRPPDIRFRAEFKEWKAEIEVEFVSGVLTAQKVINLIERAGRTIGLGEGRPEKNTDMGWGKFIVAAA